MARSIGWFVAGVLVTLLVIGGIASIGGDADAQGTWELETVDATRPDDASYALYGFILGLGPDCEFQFVPAQPGWLLWRCP
jgi:hypothetical protein